MIETLVPLIALLALVGTILGVTVSLYRLLHHEMPGIGGSKKSNAPSIPVLMKRLALCLLYSVLGLMLLGTPIYYAADTMAERLERIEHEVLRGKQAIEPSHAAIRPNDLETFYSGTIILHRDTIHYSTLRIESVYSLGDELFFVYSFSRVDGIDVIRSDGEGSLVMNQSLIKFPGLPDCKVRRDEAGRIRIVTLSRTELPRLDFREIHQ